MIKLQKHVFVIFLMVLVFMESGCVHVSQKPLSENSVLEEERTTVFSPITIMSEADHTCCLPFPYVETFVTRQTVYWKNTNIWSQSYQVGRHDEDSVFISPDEVFLVIEDGGLVNPMRILNIPEDSFIVVDVPQEIQTEFKERANNDFPWKGHAYCYPFKFDRWELHPTRCIVKMFADYFDPRSKPSIRQFIEFYVVDPWTGDIAYINCSEGW